MVLWIPDPSYAYSQCWETTTDNNRLSTSDKVQDISVCNICDSTGTRLSWSVWDPSEAFTARYGMHYHYSTNYVWSLYIYIYIYPIYIYIYTGCPRRNVPDFRRVFLMLKYTDITQNPYIQSWTVTEIMAREVWNFDSCYTLIDYQIHIKTGRNMWFL